MKSRATLLLAVVLIVALVVGYVQWDASQLKKPRNPTFVVVNGAGWAWSAQDAEMLWEKVQGAKYTRVDLANGVPSITCVWYVTGSPHNAFIKQAVAPTEGSTCKPQVTIYVGWEIDPNNGKLSETLTERAIANSTVFAEHVVLDGLEDKTYITAMLARGDFEYLTERTASADHWMGQWSGFYFTPFDRTQQLIKLVSTAALLMFLWFLLVLDARKGNPIKSRLSGKAQERVALLEVPITRLAEVLWKVFWFIPGLTWNMLRGLWKVTADIRARFKEKHEEVTVKTEDVPESDEKKPLSLADIPLGELIALFRQAQGGQISESPKEIAKAAH